MTIKQPSNSPAAQRKTAERARKREAGLKPLEVWAKPEHHAQIKLYAKQLTQTKQPDI